VSEQHIKGLTPTGADESRRVQGAKMEEGPFITGIIG
jgi:hypothetical protein